MKRPHFCVRPENPLDKYVDGFLALAKEEGMELDRVRLTRVLSRYAMQDIDRAYDAYLRFGISALTNAF